MNHATPETWNAAAYLPPAALDEITDRRVPPPGGCGATPDVLEELLILSHIERRRRGNGFLDGRVMVGSMNRGGLAGTAFEMADTFTSMTAARLPQLGVDGGKV